MNVILSGAKDQVGRALVSPHLCCRRGILRFAQDDIHTDASSYFLAYAQSFIVSLPGTHGARRAVPLHAALSVLKCTLGEDMRKETK